MGTHSRRRRLRGILAPEAMAWLLFFEALAVLWWCGAGRGGNEHPDQLYYLMVAEHIAAGDGLTANAVWQHLSPPDAIQHPAFRYWMPGTTLLASSARMALGPSHTILPFIFVGACFVVLSFLWMRRWLPGWAAWCGAQGLLWTPKFQYWSTVVDSAVPYAACLMGVLLLLARPIGGARGRRFLIGLLIGIASLFRTDAPIVAIASFALFALFPRARRAAGWRPRDLGFVAVGVAVVLLPWWLRNLSVFGDPRAPGAGLALRMQHYFDFFVTSTGDPLPSVFTNFRAAPLEFGSDRIRALGRELIRAPALLSGWSFIALFGGWWGRRRSALRWGLRLSLAVALCYGLLVPALSEFGGSFRSVLPTLAVTWAGIAAAAVWLWRTLGPRRLRRPSVTGWQRKLRWYAGVHGLVVGVSLAAALVLMLGRPQFALRDPLAPVRQRYAPLGRDLVRAGLPAAAPLFSNRPLSIRMGLDRPAVMTPIDGPEALCRTARRFSVEHVLTLDDWILRHERSVGLRLALEDRDIAEPQHGGPGWMLYRLRCPAPAKALEAAPSVR